MNLHTALTRAAALAFAEDHQQLVGCIVGSWEIAHPEDVSRSNQMDAPIFTVFSWGPDLTAMMTALDEASSKRMAPRFFRRSTADMATYYRNLPRRLTAQEETQLDAIVAAERPYHGIGTQRWAEESPCIWAEWLSPETESKLDSALARMGLRHD